MSSLLAFDAAETAARVRSVTDAQKLIDIIDSLTNNESLLSHCSQRGHAARKACLLVSEIFARVPVLPQSLFWNGPTPQCVWFREYSSGYLEYACSSAVINRFLDHNHTVPTWFIYQGDKLNFVHSSVNEQNQSVDKWLERERPNFVTRIRVVSCNDPPEFFCSFTFLVDARGSEDYPIPSFHGRRHCTDLLYDSISRGFIAFSITIV
ncbi:hypothetical protein JOM56_005106 [Amanita muscaria]